MTLIELMVVIAIAAILIGVGLPNLSSYLSTNRLDTAANELLGALQLARSEAIRRSVPVSLRQQATAGTGDWGSAGWQMFADPDRDGVPDAGEEVIRAGAPLAGGITLYGSAGFATSLTFDTNGRLLSAAGAFVVCDSAQQLVVDGRSRSRAVVINGAGRVRQAVDTNGDQIVETDTGAVTDCRTP